MKRRNIVSINHAQWLDNANNNIETINLIKLNDFQTSAVLLSTPHSFRHYTGVSVNNFIRINR